MAIDLGTRFLVDNGALVCRFLLSVIGGSDDAALHVDYDGARASAVKDAYGGDCLALRERILRGILFRVDGRLVVYFRLFSGNGGDG